MLEQRVKDAIRDVPDFPKAGIIFKDITPIMMDAALSSDIVDYLASYYKDKKIDKIAGIESRGFLFGYPLAMRLGVPFILIRKQGKLPYKKTSLQYDLEYGTSTIEMHTDAIHAGDKVLIHDDLLATGGSAAAAASLIKECGGDIAGFSFLVNLEFLNGSERLQGFSSDIQQIVAY